eukprot:4385102-Pyramimonas_sp.AAC.1
MAAAGQIFGNSLPGHFPAWVPESVVAQPPAPHAPFFQDLKPLVRRFISWLEYSARNVGRQTPAIHTWWPKLWEILDASRIPASPSYTRHSNEERR